MTDLTSDMQNEYQTLINEIEQTVSNNDRLFQEMKSAQYDQNKNYESDLKNYKINKEISTVEESRREIWDVLGKKYNDNTKLRQFYFDELVNLDKQLKKQYEQLNELVEEVKGMETVNSTLHRKIKKDKYDMNKYIYYSFMYKVLVLIQLICVVVLTLSIMGFVPQYTALVIIFIMLIGCLVFMVYYAFIANADMDKFSWDRYAARDINRSGYGNNGCSSTSKKKKGKSDEEIKLEEEVKDIISDSMVTGTDKCQ
jgi:lipopolysaccharide export LptBFGC system permease protein LptF